MKNNQQVLSHLKLVALIKFIWTTMTILTLVNAFNDVDPKTTNKIW